MYDARSGSSLGGQSSMLFGLVTVCVVAVAFFGVLLMPAGNSNASTAAASNVSTSLTSLNDKATQKYLKTLATVSPKAASALDSDAAKAAAQGASKKELGELVMASIETTLIENVEHLAKADVRHFDAILNKTESGLRQLSSSRSDWCKGAQYEKFANYRPAQMERLMLEQIAYGSGAYTWSMEMNTLLLDAVADAKSNPQRHGPLTPQDEQALQMLAMQLVSDPQVMQLMMLQGQSQADMARAARNVDFCSLAATGVKAVKTLPKGTRARLWGEAFRQANSGELRDAMAMMNAF